MKFKSMTISALFSFTAACAPVDNDDIAAVKSSHSNLAIQSPLDQLRIDAFDGHSTVSFDIHSRMSAKEPVHVPTGAVASDTELQNDVPEADMGQNSLQVFVVDENNINPASLSEPAVQNADRGACLTLGFGGRTAGRIVDSERMNLDFKTGMTIEGWIRIDNQSGVIVSKQSGLRESFWNIAYEDGQLRFTIGSDASHKSVYAAEFPASEWFHFAITRGVDVDRGTEIYIDGRNETEQLESGADTLSAKNTHPVIIGRAVSDETNNFQGSIASLHIAEGVWYSGDFETSIDVDTVESTLGLWDFRSVERGMVLNQSNDDLDIHVHGPIYGEHATICD